MLERARRGRVGLAARGIPPAPVTPDILSPRAPAEALRITWIGHSSFLLQIGGLNVLTDPVFGDRASPVTWAGPARLQPPGVALDALPPIDIVLQSHDHYDHFDDRSIRALASRHPNARWYAPLGVAAQLRARGVHTVDECDWYDEHTRGDVHVTCVPARHFAGRTISGRDATLWCGWVLRVGPHRVWFVGDTGMHPDFGAIASKVGPIDAVLMPIGAYDPRWFMAPVHMDPEEAVAAYGAIRDAHPQAPAPVMVGMHWGTFVLTDEPVDEPPRRARMAFAAAGHAADVLWILAPGETRVVPTR
jgi:N-acyl-phosphatidylethanolamine-hydrolysing phospholipase D